MARSAGAVIENVVVRKEARLGSRLLDKAFAMAFKGLVYAQIWEDPEVDMEALQIQPDSRVVTIASGGCNVLSYLIADPAKITAVDLNTAHIALGRLKVTSAQFLPDYAQFRRFFAEADRRENVTAYNRYVAPHLDETSRRYWEGRDLSLRRRIAACSAASLVPRICLPSFTALTSPSWLAPAPSTSSARYSRRNLPRSSSAALSAG